MIPKPKHQPLNETLKMSAGLGGTPSSTPKSAEAGDRLKKRGGKRTFENMVGVLIT